MKNTIIYNGQPTNAAMFLKNIFPFNLLDRNTVETVIEHAEIRKYPKGSYVFRQGDPSHHSLFVVVTGTAEATVLNEQDKEIVTRLHGELDFFGEAVFMSDEPYPGSVRVLEDLTCIVIPHEVFDTLLSKFADFSNQFSHILTVRMRTIYQALKSDALSEDMLKKQSMRKRVSDLMSSPPVTCREDDDIAVIAKVMTEKNVSSLVVVNKDNKPLGIVTERDLISKVLAHNAFLRNIKAADIMSSELLTVAPEAFYYEALLIMVKHKVKHLAVVGKKELKGIVTIRDLIISRSAGALTIVNSIEKQTTIDGLIKASKEINRVLQALVAENANSKEILQLITEFFDRLTRKVIQICEQEMEAEEYGLPPVAYSWITMGSGGRLEQFVKTDQDNGIIYDNVPPEKEEETARYFQILAEKIVEGLFKVGFAKCKGNVMASNPFWCRSLKNWRDTVTIWTNNLDSENVRMLTIFLDFRHTYGKKSLCDQLRSFVTRKFQKAPAALTLLAKDDLSHRVPLNFFKQIITEKSKEHRNLVNLKSAACVHMVDGLRIFSLREGVAETNTFRRLEELAKKGVFSPEDTEFFATAYETLMTLRIKQSLLQLSRGELPDNYVNPDELNKKEKAALREAFIAVDRMQSLVSHAFFAFLG